MKSKLVPGLLIASCAVLLLLVGFLAGSLAWRRGPTPAASGSARDEAPTPPGTVVSRDEVPNPPPPPKPVANPDRIRQNLQAGKTYVTDTRGTLHVRATDKDWGVEEVVTINYSFEAQIDREIESNDGTTVVELRHFRDIRSLKVESRLEDIHVELGDKAGLLLDVLAFVPHPAARGAAAAGMAINGSHLKQVIDSLRWSGISPEQLAGLDQSAKAFAAVDRLTGKSVRLTYVDGKGVIKVEPVQGEMTAAERDFHMASVLVSDSLIIPHVDIETGLRWSVDGSNFSNMVDPSLLARTSGKVELERAPDHLVQGEKCQHIKVVEGRILLDDSDSREGRIGYFEPRGSLYFSPRDQVIIQAELHGTGELERFSKDHLLFETRMRRHPEIDVVYTCRVQDTPKTR